MRANNPEFSIQEEINILSGMRDDSRRSLSHSIAHACMKYLNIECGKMYHIIAISDKQGRTSCVLF